jgi:hypothetical protein
MDSIKNLNVLKWVTLMEIHKRDDLASYPISKRNHIK